MGGGAPFATLSVTMYTGITRGTFPVVRVERAPRLLTYAVDLGDALSEGLEPGASVSIDGVCQTVVTCDGPLVTFHAIEETLRLTTLDELQPGAVVSVERSARLGDELGGHDVFGHVSGTGRIAARDEHDGQLDLTIECPADWMRFILPKGFIAVDGSSLTVGAVTPDGRFELHLIPETLRLTNLGRKQVGDRVNLELDSRTVAIVETVERVLAARGDAAR